MGIATSLFLLGVGAAAGTAIKKKQKKAERDIKRQQLQAQEETKIAMQRAEEERKKIGAAPEEAKERARQEAIRRRRGQVRTILTSPTGVESPGVLLRQTLGGA